MKGTWFSELQNPGVAFQCKIKKVLHEETTEFQHLQVFDTDKFGRMLVLDGCVMTTIEDEFVYHEMISLPALNTHPAPKRVLVIGGGDGGAIREIAKHPLVEKATLVEIDGKVIEYSKKFLPEIAIALENNPKVEVLVDDGIKHIQEHKNYYDIILVDSTDPVGPAVGLFEAGFYRGIYDALKEDGIFVAQTESPFFNKDLIKGVYKDIKEIFPIAKLYLAFIPTYPSGMWSFTMGSKKYDPEKIQATQIKDTITRYYNSRVHFAAFALPNFVQELLDK